MSKSNKLKFNKVECNIINKYIRKEDGIIVIDYLDEGFSFINNNKDIYCDRIEIVNGIGVLMYHNNKLIKHFEKLFIEVEFDDRFNTIVLIDKKENDRFLYIYYQNEVIPKQNEIEKVLSNKKYNIGDIVYPINIGYYKNNDYKNFNSIYSAIFWEYVAQMEGFEGLKEKTMPKEMFEKFCEICAFKIIDKIGDKYYKITMNYIDDSIEDIDNEAFFATDNTIKTLDEIKENSKELIKLRDERRNK